MEEKRLYTKIFDNIKRDTKEEVNNFEIRSDPGNEEIEDENEKILDESVTKCLEPHGLLNDEVINKYIDFC